jgi:hypothetical protein
VDRLVKLASCVKVVNLQVLLLQFLLWLKHVLSSGPCHLLLNILIDCGIGCVIERIFVRVVFGESLSRKIQLRFHLNRLAAARRNYVLSILIIKLVSFRRKALISALLSVFELYRQVLKLMKRRVDDSKVSIELHSLKNL